jgi:hypothetical protein
MTNHLSGAETKKLGGCINAVTFIKPGKQGLKMLLKTITRKHA